MKFDIKQFIKDVGDVITAKLDDAYKRVEEVEVKIKDFTPYDDTTVLELMEKQEEVTKDLQDEVKQLKEKEIPEYDDEPLKKTLGNAVENIDKLDEFTKELDKKMPSEYNDMEIRESLKSIEEKYQDTKKELEATQERLKDVENRDIKTIAPKAVEFDATPIEKGTMVKHENSLWLNLLEGNDTVPSLENGSYQQLIKAPKEIEHKGLYEEGKTYEHGDIVMLNDAGWFKTSHPSQDIPSEGWKLISKRGKQGKQGKATIIENDTTEAMQQLYDKIMLLEGEVKRLQNASKN